MGRSAYFEGENDMKRNGYAALTGYIAAGDARSCVDLSAEAGNEWGPGTNAMDRASGAEQLRFLRPLANFGGDQPRPSPLCSFCATWLDGGW